MNPFLTGLICIGIGVFFGILWEFLDTNIFGIGATLMALIFYFGITIYDEMQILQEKKK